MDSGHSKHCKESFLKIVVIRREKILQKDEDAAWHLEAAGEEQKGKREKMCVEQSSARENEGIKDSHVAAAFWDESCRMYLLFDDVKCCVEVKMQT